MTDYPLVQITGVEILPIPEALDTSSDEVAEKWLASSRESATGDISLSAINRTPEIAAAIETLRDYFGKLKTYVGHEVQPSELEPPFPADSVFKWAHRVPDSKLFVALREAADRQAVCQVVVYCRGPSLGSAGGRTLQPLGPLVDIHYKGHLVGPCSSSSTGDWR
jgi:hypothetical protein